MSGAMASEGRALMFTEPHSREGPEMHHSSFPSSQDNKTLLKYTGSQALPC